MKYSLSCQHTGYVLSVSNLAASMPCPVCGKIGRLLAVELREYHVKCRSCRYARFAGQSNTDATAIANRHERNTGHATCIDYERDPKKLKEFTKLFRRVKTVMIDPNWIGDIRRLDSGKRGYNQQSLLDIDRTSDSSSSIRSDNPNMEGYEISGRDAIPF